jgi:hypothetical protein
VMRGLYNRSTVRTVRGEYTGTRWSLIKRLGSVSAKHLDTTQTRPLKPPLCAIIDRSLTMAHGAWLVVRLDIQRVGRIAVATATYALDIHTAQYEYEYRAERIQ